MKNQRNTSRGGGEPMSSERFVPTDPATRKTPVFTNFVERLAKEDDIYAISFFAEEFFTVNIYSDSGGIASRVPTSRRLKLLGTTYDMNIRVLDGVVDKDHEVIAYADGGHACVKEGASVEDGTTWIGSGINEGRINPPDNHIKEVDRVVRLDDLVKEIIMTCKPSAITLNSWGVSRCNLSHVKVYPEVDLSPISERDLVEVCGRLQDLKLETTESGFALDEEGDVPMYLGEVDSEIKPYGGDYPQKRQKRLRQILNSNDDLDKEDSSLGGDDCV